MKKHAVWYLFFVLTACSGTGGIIGGLVPAPKFLKGHVEGDLYFAEDNAFKVMLPHPPSIDSYEWKYTKVHEGRTDKYTKVIFGPAAFDLNYYHVTLVHSTSVDDLAQHSKQLFESITKMQSYREVHEPKQLVKSPISINGNNGFYSAYKMGPSQWLLCAVVYLNSEYYVIESDVSRSHEGEFNPSKEMVKRRGFKVFNRLLESFEKPVGITRQ